MSFDKSANDLLIRKNRDAIKNAFCKVNGIHLLRVRYDSIGKADEIKNFLDSIKSPYITL